MPHSDSDTVDAPLTRLPFPPVTRSHILHCSYHFWHPLYRAITPKARLIPLSDAFLSYLRADGIVLPPEHPSRSHTTDDDSGIEASDSEDEEDDPSAAWHDIHIQIEDTIRELDGKVTPKLNWSAPKDATWIAVTNDLQCQTPNDIYMLLKSSDFITHDLEHAFDDTEPEPSVQATATATATQENLEVPYHLVLRKYFNLNPSLEFRCFVRNRTLLCMCQRDLNHFDFLFSMRDMLVSRIQAFFDEKLKDTFPDPNFVFDVYIPPPHDRVWLIDINPWAIRTDPLLFSWLEILTMKDLVPLEDEVVRLSIKDDGLSAPEPEPGDDSMAEDEEEGDIQNVSSLPELRLVGRDDPEAYGFTTPQYSAHKLPRDVVDASRAGPGGMESFMRQWKDLLAQEFQQQQAGSSDDE